MKIISKLIFSGDTLTLNCRVDEEWSICIWSHEIEDQTVRRFYDNLPECEPTFLSNILKRSFLGFTWK